MATQSDSTIPTATEDPIFAAIAAHQDAHRAFIEALDALAEIEKRRLGKDHPWLEAGLGQRETETSRRRRQGRPCHGRHAPDHARRRVSTCSTMRRSFDPKGEDRFPEGFNATLHDTTARALALILAASAEPERELTTAEMAAVDFEPLDVAFWLDTWRAKGEAFMMALAIATKLTGMTKPKFAEEVRRMADSDELAPLFEVMQDARQFFDAAEDITSAAVARAAVCAAGEIDDAAA
jgi:hypothetical protein